MNLMQDKVCVVTGSAGSIGLASSRLLLESGARIMLVDKDAAGIRREASTWPTAVCISNAL